MNDIEILEKYNSILNNAKANWIYEDYEILLNFKELYNKALNRVKELEEKYNDMINCCNELMKQNNEENKRCAELAMELQEKTEQLEICKEDLKEMTISNNHKEENWIPKLILNSYIPKSKIKEKIEELKEELKEELDELGYGIDIVRAISALEELLEE